MKRTAIFVIGVLMLVALPASAATFRVGDTYEYQGSADADDVYVAGGGIDVSGDINGDAVLAGGDITILGNIVEDLIATGGSIRVLGSVGDDARVAGGTITVSDDISGDLVAAGGLIRVLSSARVGRDAVIAGGSVFMNGSIGGDLTVYGEEVVINGPINGDVTLKFTKRVTLGENAAIAGNFTYSALNEIVVPGGAFIGGDISRTELKMSRFDKADFAKVAGVVIFFKFLLVLAASLLAVLVFKQFSRTVARETHDAFWKRALIGFIALIVVPIAAGLIFATVLGAAVGFILLSAYVLAILISKVYVGIVAGSLLSKWIKKETIVDWKWTVLGVAVVQVAALVPFFGHLATFVILLATFGTIGTLAHKRLWLTR